MQANTLSRQDSHAPPSQHLAVTVRQEIIPLYNFQRFMVENARSHRAVGENDRGRDPDVFISYNRDDSGQAHSLVERLRDEVNLTAWLDHDTIPPGANWENQIETAIERCRCCIISLGAHGWGEYHAREALLALARARENETVRVILVLLSEASELVGVPSSIEQQDASTLETFVRSTQWVDLRTDNVAEFLRLASAIEGREVRPEELPTISPYRVNKDAARWHRARGRAKSSIRYRGAELVDAYKLLQSVPDRFTDRAVAFLAASASRERLLNRITVGLLILGLALTTGTAMWFEHLRRVADKARQATKLALDGEKVALAKEIQERIRANLEYTRAEEQGRIAVAHQLATESELIASRADQGKDVLFQLVRHWTSDAFETSALLAVASIRESPSREGDHLLRSWLEQIPIWSPIVDTKAHGEVIFSPYSPVAITGVGTSHFVVYDLSRRVDIKKGYESGQISCADFSKDGSLLALSVAGRYIRIYDLRAPRNTVTIAGVSATTLIFDPTGEYLAWTDKTLHFRIIQTKTGQQIATPDVLATSLEFSWDGKWVLTRLLPDSCVFAISSAHRPVCLKETTASTWNPKRNLIGFATRLGEAGMWDPVTGERDIFSRSSDLGEHVQFSADGEKFAVSATRTTVWNTRFKQSVFEAPVGGSVRFSPDGEYLMVSRGAPAGSTVYRLSSGPRVIARVPSKTFFLPKDPTDRLVEERNGSINLALLSDGYPLGHWLARPAFVRKAAGQLLLTQCRCPRSRICSGYPTHEIQLLRLPAPPMASSQWHVWSTITVKYPFGT